jgi:hypothetical protein
MSVAFLAIGAASLHLLKLHRLQAEKIRVLHNQLSALCSGASGIDERILQFEQTISHLKEQQKTLELGGNGHIQSYENAIRLAKRGAGEAQLINNFNLSDEEAHLINRLHGDQADQLH